MPAATSGLRLVSISALRSAASSTPVLVSTPPLALIPGVRSTLVPALSLTQSCGVRSTTDLRPTHGLRAKHALRPHAARRRESRPRPKREPKRGLSQMSISSATRTATMNHHCSALRAATISSTLGFSAGVRLCNPHSAADRRGVFYELK